MGCVSGARRSGDRDGCNLGPTVGFKNVRTHTGDVTNVVAYIVSNHAWVAGIVFGDAGFDLTYEVGPDVGSLRENTTANTIEKSDERSSHRETFENLREVLLVCGAFGVESKEASETEESHRCDSEPHNGATGESDLERASRSCFVSSDTSTDISEGSRFHSDVTSCRGS